MKLRSRLACLLAELVTDRAGAVALEYALLGVLVAIAAAGLWAAIGNWVHGSAHNTACGLY